MSGGGLPTTIGVFALLRYRHPDLDDRALRRLLHRLLPMARGLARFVGIDVTALTVGHFVLAVRQDGFHLAADVAEYLRSLDEHGSSTAVSATTRTSLALPTNRTP